MPRLGDTHAAVAIGLGSAGSLFLRDLPDSDLIGPRIAIDSDRKILDAMDEHDASHRILLKLPRRYAKKPSQLARQYVADAWASALPDWTESLHPSSGIAILCVALGGVTGTTSAELCAHFLRTRGFSLITLAACDTKAMQDDHPSMVLQELVGRSLSSCITNPSIWKKILPGAAPATRPYALGGLLRAGHVLDCLATLPLIRSG